VFSEAVTRALDAFVALRECDVKDQVGVICKFLFDVY
jgi:hypothetical protein